MHSQVLIVGEDAVFGPVALIVCALAVFNDRSAGEQPMSTEVRKVHRVLSPMLTVGVVVHLLVLVRRRPGAALATTA